jgi:hypothetical protein
MYACHNVALSCNRCCCGNATMHSVCFAAIHVTVNNTEYCTTMLLWRTYAAGNYNMFLVDFNHILGFLTVFI